MKADSIYAEVGRFSPTESLLLIATCCEEGRAAWHLYPDWEKSALQVFEDPSRKQELCALIEAVRVEVPMLGGS